MTTKTYKIPRFYAITWVEMTDIQTGNYILVTHFFVISYILRQLRALEYFLFKNTADNSLVFKLGGHRVS